LLLPTGSFKEEGSIRHGEAMLNIYDITQPKQLKTETSISEELLAMLCCLAYLTDEELCWLICTELVHRSMRT